MEKNIGHYSITNYLNSTTKIVCSTALLYILFAKLTKLIFISQINLFPFYPAMGLATACAIIFGRKAILGVTIGSLLFSLDSYKQEIFYNTDHQVFINSLSICLIRPLIAVINVFLVSHFTLSWCKTQYPFNKGAHILNFSIASLLGSIIAPTIGIAFIAILSNLSSYDLQLFWSNLIRGNALGIILITPFVLSWLYKKEIKTQWSALKKIEAFILPFITLAVSIYVFVTPDHNESLLYLLLIWAAYRFNIRLITILTLIIAVVSMYYTGYGMEVFSFSAWNNNFFLLQLFLFVNMVSILFFKAILKEKEAKEYKLKISEQIVNTERNILKATIESSNTTSIFSLDTNLNYLSFNSSHEKFMKNIHGASIKIGDNHLELISYENQKKEFFSIFQSVLNGHIYEKEEKDIEGQYWKISKSPIRDNDRNIIGISVIITDISDLKLKEIQLKENNLSLNERIKELSCLYTVTKVLNRKSLSTSEKLQACAQIIPASLQFPEKTNCKIQFREKEFFSDNYKKNDLQTSRKIIINDEECGFIEMGYFDLKEINGKKVFLEEEIKLLETISDIISKSLQTKIAEENLKKSEETYRILFENVQDVFFKASLKTETILDVSPSCSQFNGITREELIDQNIYSIFTDENEVQLMLKKLFKEQKIIDYNNKILIKEKKFHISINAEILYDSHGEPKYVIGSLRDITQRRLAEENLRISEEKFRTIYENFEDIYFKTNMSGTVLDVSPSFEKHFHKPYTEALGSSVFDFYYDKKDRTLLLEKLKIKNHVSDFDAQFKDADGNLLFFSLNAHFVFDEKGMPINIEGTMRNINERRGMQEEILSKNRKLEFQNVELEQFAYIASHDLQEPLITVIHCIQLLEDELDQNLNEDQRQYLQFINNSTSRMQLLVKALLDYSRIGKDRKNSIINCNEIVSDVLADMKVSLQESNAVIEYQNLPTIEGNTTEMRQLFQNLISNANKYRKKDQQPKIKINAEKDGSNWLFSIQDNGIGIEEHDMDKVFVIFKRLHNRDEYQGTGIGLSHCKKIIEQHRGKIWVESKYNEGSTFKWTLPVEQNL